MEHDLINLMADRDSVRNDLVNLYNEVERFVSAVSREHQINLSQQSKQNICAFIAIQKLVSRDFESSLAREGLSSLKSIRPHVLHSLNKMIANLTRELKKGHHSMDNADFINAIKLKEERKQRLFGKKPGGQAPAIMVTLDRSMLEMPEIFSELLEAGMNVARINCAHDQLEIWVRLVRELRSAEKAMNEKEGTRISDCKIYMDLAGPKIRIGPFMKEKIPLVINIKNEQSIGYIVNGPDSNSPQDGAFILPVRGNSDGFSGVDADCVIKFKDLRGKDRILIVLDVVNKDCLKVRLNKTSHLADDTILTFYNRQWPLTNFEEKQVSITVKNGDVLRIYRSSQYLGRPASQTGPAAIGITLPKALNNVRPGDRIFFDDGKVCAYVISAQDFFIETRIIIPPNEIVNLKSGKGINLPESLVYLNVPALTEYDVTTLNEICDIADIIGLSFVHHPNDLKTLRDHLAAITSREIGVVAKIETKASVYHLTKIILEGLNFASFGVMIARGDLAVEIGFNQLAKVQEGILDICTAAHIPVVWATGVLDRMNKKGTPARTELTDAYMGLRADCIMLNKGPYIVESLKIIQQINEMRNDRVDEARGHSLVSLVQYGF
jgi:pyruvate kinase